MNDYQIFTRTWWRKNAKYPNGLEPSPGRKITVCYVGTEEEARDYCERENAKLTAHKLGLKYEYTRV